MGLFDSVRDKMLGDVAGEQKEIKEVSDQSNDEQKLVAYVKSKIEEGRSAGSRVAHEAIWMTNTAYLLGFTNVQYDSATRQFKTLGSRGGQNSARVHVNKILPTIQNRSARLTKSPPKYDIKPESNSTEDKDATRLGLEIINDVWDRQKINTKRLALIMWLQQCGYAFFKVSWDPCLGKPLVGPDATLEGYEGDVRVDVVSAFEVFPDPLAKTMDECSWVCQAKIRKLDYFVSTYPERGQLVKEEGAWLMSSQYEMRINSLNSKGQMGSGQDAQMKNAAIEMAYYEKRSKKYPRGRLVICANGVLLHDGPLPVGEIPFVKFDDVVIGGKFMSEAIITHLRPIQDQYNRLMTRRADWTNKLLAGKYMAAKGHGMNAEALNDRSGEILEYNPVPGASPPQAIQTPMIPQWAYEEEGSLDKQFDYISGLSEISRGELPSASIPAIGMQFLQEQDATRMGIMVEQHEQSYAEIGKLILMYASDFYKTDRVLKVAGSGLEYAVKNFTGSDIKNNHDVTVVRGSTVPNSKVLKRQEILNTYSQGLLGAQGDPKVVTNVLDMIEFGDSAAMWQDHSLDMKQIKEHLDMIQSEEQPPVHEADNHELFIQEYNRFRKSDKYKRMTTTSQHLLLQGFEEHLQALLKLTNPQLGKNKELADEMVKTTEEMAVSPDQSAGGPAEEQLAIENQQPADNMEA